MKRFDKEISEEIKETYIKEWYLSLRQISVIYGVSHQYVHKICKDLLRPTFEEVYSIKR